MSARRAAEAACKQRSRSPIDKMRIGTAVSIFLRQSGLRQLCPVVSLAFRNAAGALRVLQSQSIIKVDRLAGGFGAFLRRSAPEFVGKFGPRCATPIALAGRRFRAPTKSAAGHRCRPPGARGRSEQPVRCALLQAARSRRRVSVSTVRGIWHCCDANRTKTCFAKAR